MVYDQVRERLLGCFSTWVSAHCIPMETFMETFPLVLPSSPVQVSAHCVPSELVAASPFLAAAASAAGYQT